MSASWNYARRPFQDNRPAYAVAGLLFLAGTVLLVANVRVFTGYRRGVADVRSEIAALEGRQRSADAKAREAKAALSSYRLSAMAEESRELSRIAAERRFSWTVLLARLERTLPSDVAIQHLQPQFEKDGGISLSLQLVGRSREAVVPTLAALARDPAFTDVELHSEAQPEGNTADPFLFDLVSRYAPEAKAEPAHAPEKKADGPVGKKPAGAKPGTRR
jgi:Tfp pilus assembly protein PilN